MNRFEYLSESISDTRDTIRAIDVKLIGTLFLFAFPFTEVRLIASSFLKIYELSLLTGIGAIALASLSWLTGIIASLVGLVALENPADAVSNDSNAKGTYFGNGLYSFNFIRCFFPKHKIGIKKLSVWEAELRHSKSEIFTELAYEHMKLVFIRNLKIKRQRIAIISLGIHLITVALVLVVAIVFVNTPLD
jgi:hypothetical protein